MRNHLQTCILITKHPKNQAESIVQAIKRHNTQERTESDYHKIGLLSLLFQVF